MEFFKQLLLTFFFTLAFAILYPHLCSILNPNIRHFKIFWHELWRDAVKDFKTAPLIWVFCITVMIFVIFSLWDSSNNSEIAKLSEQIANQTQILEQIRDMLIEMKK
jgi:hypothetical protein